MEPHSSWSLSSSRPSHCQRPTTRRRQSTSRGRCVVPAASVAAGPPPPPNCCRPAPSVVDGPRHAADLQVRIPCQHNRVSILTVSRITLLSSDAVPAALLTVGVVRLHSQPSLINQNRHEDSASHTARWNAAPPTCLLYQVTRSHTSVRCGANAGGSAGRVRVGKHRRIASQ